MFATTGRTRRYSTSMEIGIIGASGFLGTRLVDEALARGHRVRAFTRRGAGERATRDTRAAIDRLVWRDLDIFDEAGVGAEILTLDVLVSAYQPGNASIDMADTLRRSIADPSSYARAYRVLVRALERRIATRLIVAGGAGSLERAPGDVIADSPTLAEDLTALGLPAEYAVAVRGAREALNLLRASNRRWTYVSPALDIRVGERTGRYRIGDDQLVVDADGRSRISYEDLAVAIVDEIEWPRFIQRRFTIGY